MPRTVAVPCSQLAQPCYNTVRRMTQPYLPADFKVQDRTSKRDFSPEAGRRRCRLQGGAPGTGGPARQHECAPGWSSTRSRPETTAPFKLPTSAVRSGIRRLLAAAFALDRVLVERGDDDARRRLVEPALRLSGWVQSSAGPSDGVRIQANGA